MANLAIFHPDVDFVVAAYRKACEMDKTLHKKKEFMQENYQRAKKKLDIPKTKDKKRGDFKKDE